MKAYRLLSVCLLPFLAHASDYVDEESGVRYFAAEPGECFNFDNRHIGQCVTHFHDRSQAALEHALTKIRGGLKRDLALFDEAQSKWAAFKESECKVRSVSAQAFQDPRRQKQLFVQVCEAELNAARIEQLKSLPLGCDSCLQ